MKDLEITLDKKSQQCITDNAFFFDAFQNDYRKTFVTINGSFKDGIPAYTIKSWHTLPDVILRSQLEHLGGYMVSLSNKMPVKVVNTLIQHLGFDKDFLQLVEDCFYLYKYQDYYADKGAEKIILFTELYSKYQQNALSRDEKTALFECCSQIRQDTQTAHLKRYGVLLFGISYDEIHRIMLHCYVGDTVIDDP